MKSRERTICVCDDDQIVLDAISSFLQSAGYQVVTAHEHKELEARLQDDHPDLLILDIRMPGHDGYWIAEGLQALGCKIPIIFMTGYDSFIYRFYAPFAGGVTYMVKPVQLSRLLKKIEQVLALQAA